MARRFAFLSLLMAGSCLWAVYPPHDISNSKPDKAMTYIQQNFDDIYSRFTLYEGAFGVLTNESSRVLDIKKIAQIEHTGIRFQVDADGDFWITANAYWDGTNWQREDTSEYAWGIEMMRVGDVPGETPPAPATAIWRAVPGANPISSTFGSVGGWEVGLISTFGRALVVGGDSVEMDGNGSSPFGRFTHLTSGGVTRTGMSRNLYADFADRDAQAVSWFAGIIDDYFEVQRSSAGASINLIQLLSVSSTGYVHILPVGNADVELEVSDGSSTGGGTIHRASSATHSERSLKSDIEYLMGQDREQAYNDIKNMRLVDFRYKKKEPIDETIVDTDMDSDANYILARNPNAKKMRGLIYEEAPASVKDDNGSIIIDKRIANLELTVQLLIDKIEELEAR